jgi:glycosyltransferase involved in cell wall biosynthesis
VSSDKLFSFVIPVLNEEACIAACIQSIKAQAEAEVEIIVVDNGCTDRTIEISRQLGCRVVNEEKPGLSHARNRGAEAAEGEIVCFIDADGVLSRNWLAAARGCFADPRIGGVSGLSIYTHPNLIKQLYYNLYVVVTSGSALISSVLFSRMIFAGNNLAIRRDIFLRIGGYEPIIAEGMWMSHRFWKLSDYKGRLCLGMVLWNSSRGFEAMGFLRTLHYWVTGAISKKSQAGYTYKSR